MKTNITLLLFTFGLYAGNVIAQDRNPECETNLSIFFEPAKIKNYDGAYDAWKMVRETCPGLHAAIYVYGEKILKHKIKNSTDEERADFIDQLLTLYPDSYKYFPDKFTKGMAQAREALLKYDEKRASDEEIYQLLHTSFTQDRKNFKNPKALYLYFSTLVKLHENGKKDLQEVFNTYDDVTERIDEEHKRLSAILDELQPVEEAGSFLSSKQRKKLKLARVNSETYGKIGNSIEGLISNGLSDCENLIPLYQKNFETKKEDVQWLKRTARRMDSNKCTDNSLFVKLVDAFHGLEPSAQSAYYLGRLYDKQGQSQKAKEFYEESVELEEEPYEKAKALLKIAYRYKKKNKSKARTYARRVLEYQPYNGKAYLLMATLYGNSANECGNDVFHKKAVYWKAADVARRAGRVDPSVKVQAAQLAASYTARAPTKTEIFERNMHGKTVTFDCWVKGKVTVPELQKKKD